MVFNLFGPTFRTLLFKFICNSTLLSLRWLTWADFLFVQLFNSYLLWMVWMNFLNNLIFFKFLLHFLFIFHYLLFLTVKLAKGYKAIFNIFRLFLWFLWFYCVVFLRINCFDILFFRNVFIRYIFWENVALIIFKWQFKIIN